MCTLVVAWQVFADAPIVAAANRDELLDRASEPPARRDWHPPAVAPLDRKAGGTWIGYNAKGVFVAITNRWSGPADGGERSRGLLVRDVLGEPSAEDGARVVERAVEQHVYDGFNLLIADANAAVYLEWDGSLTVRNFEPGIHVVVNVGADGDYTIPTTRVDQAEEQATSADAVRTALQPEPAEESADWLERATAVISDHDYGVCVHGNGYGTRSSSLIRLDDTGFEYEFAPGPPCETPYESVEAEL